MHGILPTGCVSIHPQPVIGGPTHREHRPAPIQPTHLTSTTELWLSLYFDIQKHVSVCIPMPGYLIPFKALKIRFL